MVMIEAFSPENHVRRIGPPSVLIVDSDLVTQAVLTNLLSHMGCLADTASCAEDAVRLLGEKPYDLVFLDAFLPDEHGSKLAKAIRCSNHSQFVTIIAISTDDDPSNVRRMQDAGADDFITKPLFTEHIRRVVERWLA